MRGYDGPETFKMVHTLDKSTDAHITDSAPGNNHWFVQGYETTRVTMTSVFGGPD